MAKNKAVETPQAGNLGNGPDSTVDTTNTNTVPAVDTNKVLIGKMKSIGLDSKGLYTDWSTNPEDAIDTIDFMVKKHKLDDNDKAAILAMFAKMQLANTPKIKTVKPVPDGLAEDLAQAFYHRQQVLAQYEAAKKAVETLWCAPRDASKLELDAACKAVVDAGLFPDRKTGTIKPTKSGTSTTDGTHGNAGKQKLSIGWTIQIGTVNYTGWKDVAEKLVPSVFKGETNTNYLSNTPILDKVIELGLPVEVWCKIALKDQDHDAALTAWGKSTAKAKLDAHPSITVHVS